MKGILIATGVLGIALVFGQCERAPASSHTEPVTSSDVRLVSERMTDRDASEVSGKNARGSRGKGPGGPGRKGGAIRS